MTETQEQPTPPAQPARRRFFQRAAIATLVAAVATGIGFKAFAHAHGPGGWRGGFMHGPMDPAAMEAHLDRMVQHLSIEIGATDAQKQQLEPIVKAAARDVMSLRGQMREDRRQALAVLTSDPIDRTALEAIRVQHVQRTDQISKRVTQALADVANVLTSEQRRQLADRVGRMHGPRG
jgi:protein CpxP